MEYSQTDRPPVMSVEGDPKDRQEIQRNTRLLVYNGGLMMMAMTFVSSDLVLPAFVQTLTESSVLIGLAGALMRIGWAWPQVFISRIIEPQPRKMPLFVFAGMLRSLVWILAGVMVFWIGAGNPLILLLVFMVLYGIATSMMGTTNVPWMDIIGKAIPSAERTRMFAVRRLVGGLTAMGAGAVISYVLSDHSGLDFPGNYALLFVLSGIGTALSVWIFSKIREPIQPTNTRKQKFGEYMLNGLKLLREDSNYLRLCIVQFLWAFSMMASPFYVPYALSVYGISAAYVGVFVSVTQFSSIFSNVLWAWIANKQGEKALFVYGTYFMGISILIPLLTGFVPDHNMVPLAFMGVDLSFDLRIAFYSLTFVFSGFATSGMFTARMTYVLDIAPPDRRPTYTSFMNMFMLPQGFLPIFGGALVAWISYQNMFLIALIFIPISAVMAGSLKNMRDGKEV